MSFDSQHKNCPERNKTEYTYLGQTIVLAGKRGHRVTHSNPDYLSMEQRTEGAALYAVLGDFKQVAELMKVPEKALRLASKDIYWDEVQRTVARESADKFLGKINGLLESALVMLEDRITNGDCEYTPARIGKNGDLICEEAMHRVPIKGRDLSQIFHALTGQRNLMEGRATSIVQNSTTEEKLLRLQQHFKEFSKLTVIEGTATEVVPEGDNAQT